MPYHSNAQPKRRIGSRSRNSRRGRDRFHNFRGSSPVGRMKSSNPIKGQKPGKFVPCRFHPLIKKVLTRFEVREYVQEARQIQNSASYLGGDVDAIDHNS